MSASAPRIALGPERGQSPGDGGDWLGFVLLVAEWLRGGPHFATGRVLAALIDEGRAFAETPSGRRWRAILIESGWAAKGWLLWNMLEMDALVADVPARPDGATAAIENLAALIRAAHGPDRAAAGAPWLAPQPLAEPPAGLDPETLYDERNAFLDFALGTVAVTERALTSLVEIGEPLPPVGVASPLGDAAHGPILR